MVFAKLSQDARVVYLDVLDSPHTIRYAPVAGEFKSIHANSLGKALISCWTSRRARCWPTWK